MSASVVLCCPDKFRGSLTAREAAEALVAGVARAGKEGAALPLADGGEGTLEALCPDPADRRTAWVAGPLGELVEAEWGLRQGTAIIEMARASGLALTGANNNPLRATTTGTGELIRAALDAGAGRVIVAVGGSATTDGGLGALEALGFDLGGVEVLVACDVSTSFVAAARIFGPQKGASGALLDELEQRLASLAERYQALYDVDVTGLTGAGAAGGLAGGLAAVGARLVPGAALVAAEAGLPGALAQASLVLTGEGRLDVTSFAGKVVGHVLDEAERRDVPAAVVAGDVVRADVPHGVRAVSLVERSGSREAAVSHAKVLVAEAAAELVARAAEGQVSD